MQGDILDVTSFMYIMQSETIQNNVCRQNQLILLKENTNCDCAFV